MTDAYYSVIVNVIVFLCRIVKCRAGPQDADRTARPSARLDPPLPPAAPQETDLNPQVALDYF